jgi:hypothetical protein
VPLDNDATRPGWNVASIDGSALGDVTRLPFRPKASRSAIPPLGYVMTTERCTAVDLGLIPRVITRGQLPTPALMDEILAIGVSEILVSVDSIDPDQYARIRRGSSSRVPDHHRRAPSLF